MTRGFPHDYIYYLIQLTGDAIFVDDDFDYIAQWKNAVMIRITAYNNAFNANIVGELLKRIDQLKAMTPGWFPNRVIFAQDTVSYINTGEFAKNNPHLYD